MTRRPVPLLRHITLLAALLGTAGPLHAQERLPIVELVTPGSAADGRERTMQLLGEAPADGYLIRSTWSRRPEPPATTGGIRWEVVAPELGTIWNSALPYSQNDAAVWAGRGFTTWLTGGARVEAGPVSFVLAPQVGFAQNRALSAELPADVTEGGGVTLPWYTGSTSADLPLRFGDSGFGFVDPGQSALTVRTGSFAFGASTESQWWGPGIRNALVMSSNAPGIPHLFARTAAPLPTRLGKLEARWMIGALSESAHFDTVAANDTRSLSGVVATFSPGVEPGLTVGVARTVQATVSGKGAALGHAADALFRWGRTGEAAEADFEQITSLFGRWILPNDGLEVYGEWARTEFPLSPGDFVDYPHHTQGYTVGVQWVRPIREDSRLRLQGELTYLEQSATYRTRAVKRYYTSPTVTQGYTHRGQVIGAAIGPGASAQWLALDHLARGWEAGVFAGRTRWDNDAYYGRTAAWPFLGHDVSVYGGIRGSYALGRLRVDAELTTGTRMNFLYQNRGVSWETADDAVDVTNHTLRLGLSHSPRRTATADEPVVPAPALPPGAPSETAAPGAPSSRDVAATASPEWTPSPPVLR